MPPEAIFQSRTRALGNAFSMPDRTARTKNSKLVIRSATVAWILTTPVLFNLSTRVWVDSGGLRAAVMLVIASTSGAILMFAPGLAVLAAIEKYWNVPGKAAQTCIAVASSGTMFWLLWWVWVLAPNAGRVVAVALWISTTFVLTANRTGDIRKGLVPIALVLSLAPLAAIAAVGMLSIHGGIATTPDLAAATTYATADNMFPQQWIERVESRGDLRAPALGWPMVDRPPAQAAWILPAYSIASNKAFGYEVLSATLSGIAATALAVLLYVMGLRGIRLTAALALCVLTVFMFFNIVFTMPKLLTGALFVLALAAVLAEGRRMTPPIWAAAGAALALSTVAHSGGLLALPALLVVMGARRSWPRDRWSIFSFLGTGLAVMSPWLAYQIFYDRPVGSLLKWHLAGITDPEDSRSLTRGLLDQYRALGVHGILRQRWGNAGIFVGSESLTAGNWSATTAKARMIYLGALAPLWSNGILVIAAPLFVWWKRMPRNILLVTLAGITSLTTWMVIEFGPPSAVLTSVNGPFANYLILGTGLAAAAAAILPGRVLGAFVLIQVVVTVWVIPHPTSENDRCVISMMCMPRVGQVLPTTNNTLLIPIAIAAIAAVGFGAVASTAFAEDVDEGAVIEQLTGSPSHPRSKT
jgi:hypothetical protein